MEDAHRLGIVNKKEIEQLLFGVLENLNVSSGDMDRNHSVYQSLKDDNAAVSFLRAKAIGELVKESAEHFVNNRNQIIDGTYESTLIDDIEKNCPALNEIVDISVKRIYNHDSVIEIEIAGYNVLSELLGMFIPAVLFDEKTAFHKQMLKLLPSQYNSLNAEESAYEKVMHVIDHVSAMTDIYATDLYRKLKGIEISKHR